MLKRYDKNPIIEPIISHPWESVMTFNAGAIHLNKKVHLLYRARGVTSGVSRIGYASSKDGLHIDERLDKPIFLADPMNDMECFGCEDPRIVKIGDKIYMTYTAYGQVPGVSKPCSSIQLAITSISVSDFLAKRWSWGKRLYPFPRVDNKDAMLFPEKINGKYVMYHRIPPHIWVTYSDDLVHWYNHNIVMSPTTGWEYFKIGGGAPPIKTEKGWLFIYHAVDRKWVYRLGVAFIDLNNPEKVIYRHKEPVLGPEEEYEKTGVVSNVTFSCGAIVKDDTLFVYYGGSDTTIGVATAPMKEILSLF